MLKSSIIHYLLICSQVWSMAGGTAAGSANPVWQYNNPQYASAQYDRIFGQERLGPFQYRYVDYQQNCQSGGEPVCATNGSNYFYFENDCKLEAANMKMLFQHGTALEPTELIRCQPQCDSIRCNNVYAPVCAAPEQGPEKLQGVTYANECEAQRRGCSTNQTMRILNKGPCKQKTRSRGNGKRKHSKQRRNRSTTTTTTSATPSNKKRKYSKPSSFKAAPIAKTATTTSTTPVPMQFHQFRAPYNPGVSVSRAVNPYRVYNIPDYNYDAIMDSSLSLYVPGVGTVTDAPPSRTRTRTTTTTTTQRPTAAIPTGFTVAPKTSSAVPKQEFKFFFIPYVTSSTTTTESINVSVLKGTVNSSSSSLATPANTIAGTTSTTTVGYTAGTTGATTLSLPQVVRNATVSETTTETVPKTHLSLSEAI